MESPVPANRSDPDLFFAWMLAVNTGVRAFGVAMSRRLSRRSASIHGQAGFAG
jgi:hypothetical protein